MSHCVRRRELVVERARKRDEPVALAQRLGLGHEVEAGGSDDPLGQTTTI
jgi:hypothetical protein